jgi:hypothetical protein
MFLVRDEASKLFPEDVTICSLAKAITYTQGAVKNEYGAMDIRYLSIHIK